MIPMELTYLGLVVVVARCELRMEESGTLREEAGGEDRLPSSSSSSPTLTNKAMASQLADEGFHQRPSRYFTCYFGPARHLEFLQRLRSASAGYPRHDLRLQWIKNSCSVPRLEPLMLCVRRQYSRLQDSWCSS